MKFKLDECLDTRLADMIRKAGHEADTVHQENLSGADDEKIYSACLDEQRTLLTQDMDFSNPFRFSPLSTQGIIVIKNPSQLLSDARQLVDMVISKIDQESPIAKLWVADARQIRIWPTE